MSMPSFQKKLLPTLIALALGTLASATAAAADPAPQAASAAAVAPAAAQTADAAPAADTAPVIEVHGIRERLKRNLADKRDSGNIIDTVTAEEVGKFPDKNVADSLQRVPGISVDRTWGEGRDIFVRGTDKNLNLTQLNGQAVASGYWWKNDSQSRGFNYDILASELVGSLDVYKSPSADLDEGSIGGLVIVKTRKPLQLKPLVAQISVEETHSVLPNKNDPQLSGLVSWKNDAGTLGALVSISKQKRTMRRDGLEDFTDTTKYNVIDQNKNVTPGVYASWGGGSAIFRQDRERTTGDVTLQMRPNANTDISLNYLNSDMSMDNSNQNYLWQAGGLADAKGNLNVINPRFITTSDGTKALVGGTVGPTNGVSFEPIYRQSYIKSKVLDLEGTYDADTWKLHGQAGTTSGAGGSTHDRNLFFAGNTQTTFNIAPDTYQVSYLNMSPLDASKLTLQTARDWIRRMETKENYGQTDLTLDLKDSFFKDIKMGLKLRDTTVQNHRTIGTDGPGNVGWQSFSLADLSTGPSPLLSQQAANAGSLTQYAWVNDSLAMSKAFPMYDKGMVYAEATGEYYRIKETITAAYAKADFSTDQWRGDVGLRLVHTEQSSDAYQDLTGAGVYTLGTVKRSYNDLLPSLNAIYNFRRDLLLRGAVARVMARNTYSDLSASTEVSGTTNAATAGNPYLKPYHANQGELGAEWYFADASLLSATVFTKKLDTFIYTSTAVENVAGVMRPVTRPHNANNGETVNGLEFQYQQAFASGFGTVFNYTYTDATTGSVVGTQKLNVVGNSKHQLNASGYYEQKGFSVRLSYNYRSKVYGNLDEGGQDVTSAYGQWDASANYDINPHLSVYATAVNITNELSRTNTSDGLPTGVYENGARYSIGLKAKF